MNSLSSVLSINHFIKFEKDEIEQSIAARFEKQVSMFADRVAIKSGVQEMTYDTLNKSANRLAHAILSELDEGQESVSLLFEHDVSAIAAILGILKAGKMYIPLDSSYPPARLDYMLRDSQSSLIVTNDKNLSLASDLSQDGIPTINFDEIDTKFPADNPDVYISPDRLACILYTSGSTGKPKGVVDNHRNILHNMMIYTNAIQVCSEDRLTLFHSCSFGASRLDIFGALLNGAVLYPLDLKQNSFSLTRWLNHENITIYHSTPTVFRHYMNLTDINESFPEIRLLHLGSEPVYAKDVDIYKKYFSQNCIFVNRLGTTETGTVRLYFIDKNIRIDGNIVPAGYAVDDTEINILDDDKKKIEDGRVGEIGIKSRYLSPGYWGMPELTHSAFLDGDERIYLTGDLGCMLPDGCLIHLGRKDFQTKIRGYMAGIAEVESALWALNSVKAAAVVSRKDKNGNERLVAYIVPSGQKMPTVTELRRELGKILPDYMIPSAFVKINDLPMTSNGKLHRELLPEPDTARPELENSFIPPQTPLEDKLAGIWSQILALDNIGVQDNFFELGGNSLLATQIISRILDEFQVEVPLKSFFQSPTVANMAIFIAKSMMEEFHKESIESILGEIEGKEVY
jgi:amino acid adenylation domain-containing protein